MKLPRSTRSCRSRQRGFFMVAMMLTIVSIMLIYAAANTRRLSNLRKEIRLVEEKQIQRLNRSTNIATNQPTASIAAAVTAP